MKNLLLINPPIPEFIQNRSFQLPITLMYLSHHIESTLTANTEIYDFNCIDYTQHIEYNAKYFDYVGITCLFSGMFPFVNELSKTIKGLNPNTKIIIGGMHPTIFAKEIITNCPHIDYVVVGEGEVALRKIISEDKKLTNICFRDHNGDVVLNQGDNSIDINLLSPPWLSADKLNFHKYKQDLSNWVNPKGLKFNISIPLITTRGCPNGCNFCSVFRIGGRKIRSRSHISVVNEIEWFFDEYDCNRFSFYDDNIIAVPNHIENICKEIIKRKLNIQWETLSGFSINRMTHDIADLMVEAGWVRSMIPIESGNDHIRNSIMKKNLPREKIFDITEYIKNKYPWVLLRALFIAGLPEDTNETLQDTYDMICDLNVDQYRVHDLIPFPGTAIFDQCLKDNLFFEEVDVKNLWKSYRSDFGTYKGFYIKPYQMTKEDLFYWQDKFEKLIQQKES